MCFSYEFLLRLGIALCFSWLLVCALQFLYWKKPRGKKIDTKDYELVGFVIYNDKSEDLTIL